MGGFTWWTEKNVSLKVHTANSFFVHGDYGIEVYVQVLDHADVLKGAVPHKAAEHRGISEDVAYCFVLELANKRPRTWIIREKKKDTARGNRVFGSAHD
jgi:hypothetical protein